MLTEVEKEDLANLVEAIIRAPKGFGTIPAWTNLNHAVKVIVDSHKHAERKKHE